MDSRKDKLEVGLGVPATSPKRQRGTPPRWRFGLVSNQARVDYNLFPLAAVSMMKSAPMVLARAFRLPALVGLLAGLWVCPARADLREYVKKADPAFAWKLNKKSETAQGTVYDFHLVSQ